MKKIYIIPIMDVVRIKHNTPLLQASATYTTQEAEGDAEVLSRDFGFGDEEE